MRTFSLLFFDWKFRAPPVKGGLNPCSYLLAAWDNHCRCINRLCVLAANRILISPVTSGKKNFYLSGGLPMLLAKVMKSKSSMTCIKISNGTVQLDVCHSTFSFHSFCHRGAELETIKQRITSPKGLSGTSLAFSPSFLFEHTAVLKPSYSFRIYCFAYFWGVCRSQVIRLCLW